MMARILNRTAVALCLMGLAAGVILVFPTAERTTFYRGVTPRLRNPEPALFRPRPVHDRSHLRLVPAQKGISDTASFHRGVKF